MCVLRCVQKHQLIKLIVDGRTEERNEHGRIVLLEIDELVRP